MVDWGLRSIMKQVLSKQNILKGPFPLLFWLFNKCHNCSGKSEINTNILPKYTVFQIIYHYSYVTMSAIASQITGVSVVYSIGGSGPDQRNHQSSASLAFVRGIHRWPVNSPHKGPVTRKMFPFHDVIMYTSDLDGGYHPTRLKYRTELSIFKMYENIRRTKFSHLAFMSYPPSMNA